MVSQMRYKFGGRLQDCCTKFTTSGDITRFILCKTFMLLSYSFWKPLTWCKPCRHVRAAENATGWCCILICVELLRRNWSIEAFMLVHTFSFLADLSEPETQLGTAEDIPANEGSSVWLIDSALPEVISIRLSISSNELRSKQDWVLDLFKPDLVVEHNALSWKMSLKSFETCFSLYRH